MLECTLPGRYVHTRTVSLVVPVLVCSTCTVEFMARHAQGQEEEAESRKQKAESRKQKAESTRQKAESTT